MTDQILRLRRLDAADSRPDFSCGDQDIDEFFHRDSIDGCRELLCVTYGFFDTADEIIGFFSLSNDAIKKEEVPRSALKRMLSQIPHTKRYSSMPAAKIGRIGISKNHKRSGFGTQILDYLKASFTTKNKTGCRFLLVDAYNQDAVLSFYQKNGFEFLVENDKNDKTRIMYFDLIRFFSSEPA